MESTNLTPPLRPNLVSSTSSRRSFLQKLPVTLPKLTTTKAPHPRRFIPFRSGAFSRAKSSLPSDPAAKPLAQLVIRVLKGRNLVAKDKNGLSDPFCVIRYGGKRVQSATVKKSLNPVWGSDQMNTEGVIVEGVTTEAKLSVDVYEQGGNWREAVEVVVWDMDRVGKQYLGEISVGLQDFLGESNSTKTVGFHDNEPIWYPIRSSRSRATVSGDLLVQIGFVDPITSNELSPVNREALLKVLEKLGEEDEGSRRASKEERVLLASPTESVGTTLISDNLPLGTSPPRTYLPLEVGEEEEEEASSSDSESSESSDATSGDSTDDEGEGEEEGTEGPFSPDEPALPSSDYISHPRSTKSTEPDSLDPTTSPFFPIPITLTPPPLSPVLPIFDSPLPTTTPSLGAPPTLSPITLNPPPTARTSSTNSIRRGITSFMKRKGSGVSNLKGTSSVGTESEGGGNGTNSDVASGSGSNGPGKVKEKIEKKRRFSRKKSKDVSILGELGGENEGDDDGEITLAGGKKSRGKRRYTRNKNKSEVKDVADENEKKESKKARKTRRTKMGKKKRDYKYEDDDDIFGLVQIEIRSAKDLPKFKNMLKTGWDMDPFVVISFGQKVFRTRVVRHQLNPVWDEKLFFHVRRTEVGWSLNFNVYDWDKMSSNDYVGEISVPLEELIGSTIQSDDRGLYPVTPEGKLIGDAFQEHDLAIKIENPELGQPTLQIRAKFTPYDALRQQFWRTYLRQYDIDESAAFSHLEIFSMLDSLGSTLSKDTIASFFSRFGKTEDMELTSDEVVICLEQELRRPISEKRTVDETIDSGLVTPNLHTANPSNADLVKQTDSTDLSTNMETIQIGEEVVTNKELGTVVKVTKSGYTTPTTATGSSPAQLSDDEGAEIIANGGVERVINIRECPLCRKPRLNNKMEVDIVTHLGICSSTDPRSVNRIVVGSYVTASQAQRKWFTKVISKATNGAYSLGANSANIIVQDRQTGKLQEEKISTYIRLGIRLAYKGVGTGGGMEGNRIRRMLESMSIKQGVRFNSPASVREIEPFIAFHNLPMSEVLEPMSSFKSFNEFFYRKLKPEARPVADPNDPRTLVSPADCRAMFFETINEATTFWIKGREFSIQRLLGEGFKDKAHLYEGGSLAIFRLAPQDYHRYHSPVDGIVGPYHKIAGKYFTVNPMAVRSAIDIYGENIRVVGAIYSPVFGEVINVWVGAMLVGSIAFTKQEGDSVARGEEIGYFAFGGSTIINIFPPGVVKFDEDLLTNSKASLETLVRMGSRIGRKVGA